MNYFIIPGLEKNRSAVPTSRIIEAVNEYFGVDVLSTARNHSLAYARYVCFYLIYYYGTMKVTSIAKMFGKDHTTVVHGKQQIEGFLQMNTPEADHIRHLEDQVLGAKRVRALQGKYKRMPISDPRPPAHYSNISPMGIATELHRATPSDPGSPTPRS